MEGSNSGQGIDNLQNKVNQLKGIEESGSQIPEVIQPQAQGESGGDTELTAEQAARLEEFNKLNWDIFDLTKPSRFKYGARPYTSEEEQKLEKLMGKYEQVTGISREDKMGAARIRAAADRITESLRRNAYTSHDGVWRALAERSELYADGNDFRARENDASAKYVREGTLRASVTPSSKA